MSHLRLRAHQTLPLGGSDAVAAGEGVGGATVLGQALSDKRMADFDVAVIGAGAAGMMAAARAGLRYPRVVLLEKNRKAGVKILMSGGTRCNITQATDRRGIVTAFGPQGSFLHSALAALGPEELVALFNAEGVATKVEATGKVFPVSDSAVDVRDALLRLVRQAGVELRLGEAVREINRIPLPVLWEGLGEGFQESEIINPLPVQYAPPRRVPEIVAREGDFVITTENGEITAEKVILTTGGQSYPGCGTTGDGYAWAKNLGHTIIPPRPALVPLKSPATWVHELSGLTIPDVRIQMMRGEAVKPLAERRGSFLFTHVGLSGPAPMDVSRAVTVGQASCLSSEASQVELQAGSLSHVARCDFLPNASRDELLGKLAEEAASNGKRAVGGIVAEWLPRRLSEALLKQADIAVDHRVAELGKPLRAKLVDAIKQQPIPISGTLGFKKAEVTAGGVSLGEVDSRTMQSKLVPGLFLAGEILDLDGPIGGYNFQAAFSTGWLAGEST
jgi:predicted Rossmann fold flavoprotein